MFSRLSISARLRATMVLLGALIVAIGLLAQFDMHNSSNELDYAYSNQLSSSIAVGKANLNLTIVRTTLDRVLLHPEASGTQQLIDKAQSYLDISDRAWHDYSTQQHEPEEQPLADAVTAARTALVQQAIVPMMDALKRGDHATADDLVMKSVPALSVALTKSSDALAAWKMDSGQHAFNAAQQRFHTLRIVAGVLIAIGLAACVACALGLHRSISAPLANVLDHLRRIASGDLTGQLNAHVAHDSRSQDEMGKLVDGLKTMQGSLTQTVRNVMHSSESIVTATRQIAAGNDDLSQRTEEQAASLQQTAASMAQLTSTVKQNADHAREAQTLTGNANDIAVRGATVVGNVVDTMGEIDRSSQKIADITGVIESIAFQTNILALNAAVEAARAGDQGRGFAVVAGEVRSLAQRAGVAAREIKELIGDSVERVNTGARLVGTAGETMEEIRQAISHVTAIMNEIAAASDEQRDGIEQVNRAVSQMDQVSQQNAALVEEAAAAAAALDGQANSLRQAVAVFRVSA
ncbi:methyl-accepting chemotaxis protein [Paraburkholderia flava]|uniref:methyl-accepting chemotaxis protein n=1 Tax=Paraburkholderia flava TaxID=2547393 RepID=UPI00105BDD96|nr:methyl-accepting chemotaxis protein [Paraburkholderia flava]